MLSSGETINLSWTTCWVSKYISAGPKEFHRYVDLQDILRNGKELLTHIIRRIMEISL